MSGGRRWGDVLLVVAAAVAAAVVLGLLGLPSAALFGGLLAGLARGLAGRRRLVLPRPAVMAAQATLGVSIGSLVDLDTLAALGQDWLPVLLVVLGTLTLSLVAGLLLRLQPGISPVTGAFAMIAGGASGITAMARDLGADDRMVAVLQYLRVLLIVLLMPVVATAVYGASSGPGDPAADGGGPGWPLGLLFTAGCALAGVLLARLLHVPVPALLGPLLVAAALDLSGLSGGAEVPALLGSAAFVAIGLNVGVSFDRASLRTIGRALPLALAVIAGVVVASAGLGAVLAAVTGASPLDAYLATTPGGLYAVLATATEGGADATFVLAVQVLRLFVMLGTAPLVARWLRRRPV
ncbi:AbrB family transcriptional regulator [Blastococcus sp. SYSU D00813]